MSARLSLLLAFAAAGAQAAPLGLGEAQSLLFARAPELRSDQFATERSRAQLAEVRSAFWPSLDASASYQAFTEPNRLHVDFPPPFGTVDRSIGDRDREEYGIDLSYPLFAGGLRRATLLSRRAALKSAEASLKARRNQLSLRLASLFYAWHIADAAREAQTGVVEIYADAWKRTAAEVRQGGALKSREAMARSRWLSSQADLQAATDTRDSLSRAAALLLGLPAEASPEFRLDSSKDASGPPNFSAPPSGVRPELAAIDLTSESLKRQESGLNGAHLPSISAMAGYRLANPGLNMGSEDYMNYGLVGLQLRWNLFDGFRSNAQRAQLRAQRDALGVERERQNEFWNEAAISADRQAARLSLDRQAAEAAYEGARESLREKSAQEKQGAASPLETTEARVQEVRAALQLRRLALQERLIKWQQRFARGETLVFSRENDK